MPFVMWHSSIPIREWRKTSLTPLPRRYRAVDSVATQCGGKTTGKKPKGHRPIVMAYGRPPPLSPIVCDVSGVPSGSTATVPETARIVCVQIVYGGRPVLGHIVVIALVCGLVQAGTARNDKDQLRPHICHKKLNFGESRRRGARFCYTAVGRSRPERS